MLQKDWKEFYQVREALQNRRSIRKYKSVPIDWDIIGELILAGSEAPTAGNLQARKFIVIMDKGKKQKIAEAAYQQHWIAEAPLVIVIVAEPEKLSRFYGIRGERLYSIQECAVAAENMIILGEAMGLGSCFVSAFDEEEVRAICSIPKFARPQIILTFGYPNEQVPEPPKYILRDLAHLNNYGGHIADIENYVGYHWGRDVKKGVKSVGKWINKTGEKTENKLKEIHRKIKEEIKKKISKKRQKSE